jgi:hypothetical protein
MLAAALLAGRGGRKLEPGPATLAEKDDIHREVSRIARVFV